MVTQSASFDQLKLDFTDDQLTAFGGYPFLSKIAKQLDLFSLLEDFKPIKQRQRGASDQDNLWALMACLASGRGRLKDLDELAESPVDRLSLGLEQVSDSRRMSDWLGQVTPEHVESLRELANAWAKQLVPMVMAQERERLGYVPIFVDGSEIEVTGHQEGAVQTYSDSRKYWLYSAFVGPLQVMGRLDRRQHDAVGDWRQQFEQDIDPLIAEKRNAWVLMDNAYYNGKIVSYLDKRRYRWSMSVTNPNTKRPILALANPEGAVRNWTPLPKQTGDTEKESALWVKYQPQGWHRPIDYVVVRRWKEDKAKNQMFSDSQFTDTVIAASTARYGLKETIRRHRSKQGCENHFKGPLTAMDLHHPPTSKLASNQLYYEMSSDIAVLFAQMLLIATRMTCLLKRAQHHSLRTIIRELIRCVAKRTRSGGYYTLKFSKLRVDLYWLIYASDVYDSC